jgi:hypothetical protein
VWLPEVRHEVLLHRSELEELVAPLLLPTVEALGRVVASAGLRPDDLDAVLLVGGSSRIPLITRQVSAGLGRPIAVDAHPKHPVALGAALDADAHGVPAATAPTAVATTVAAAPPVAAPPSPAPAPPAPAWSPGGQGPGFGPGQGPGSGQSWSPPGPGGVPSGPPSGQGFPPYRTVPPVPPSRPGAENRRTLVAAIVAVASVLVLIVVVLALQGSGDPDDTTTGTTLDPTGNTSSEITTGATSEFETTTTSTPGSTVPAGLNLLTDDASPALDAFAGANGAPPRVYELTLFPDYAFASLQVPGEPEHVDDYQWRDGQVTGPEPTLIVMEEGDELQAKFFDLTEVDPAVIPGVVAQTMQECGENLELTHVIIDRDLTFDDAHRVLIRVYASNDYSDGGYMEYTLDGTFVDNLCE